MMREVDLRDPNLNRVTPEREDALRELATAAASRLPDVRSIVITRFDPMTGNPAAIEFKTGRLVTDPVRDEQESSLFSRFAAPDEGRFTQRALMAVRHAGPVLGLAPGQMAEFEASGEVQRTSSGGHAVPVQQKNKSILIYDATQTVRFGPRGAISGIVGRSVTVPRDVPAVPALSASEAALIAARHVTTPDDGEPERDVFGEPITRPTVNLAGFTPRIMSSFRARPEQPTVLEGGPLGAPMQASLQWFPLGESIRLAWTITLSLPEAGGRFRVMVDAQDGRVLFARSLG